MIDVKKAAQNAVEYLTGMGMLNSKQAQSLEVEEVELSEDEQFWFITLSYFEDVLMARRKYKVFKIRARDGKVFSMKIREVA